MSGLPPGAGDPSWTNYEAIISRRHHPIHHHHHNLGRRPHASARARAGQTTRNYEVIMAARLPVGAPVAGAAEHARAGASFLRPGWLGESLRSDLRAPGAGTRRAGAPFLAAEMAAKGHHEATPMHQPPGRRRADAEPQQRPGTGRPCQVGLLAGMLGAARRSSASTLPSCPPLRRPAPSEASRPVTGHV